MKAPGEPARLYVDMPAGSDGPAAGDWLATYAGARYLVLSSSRGRTRHDRWHCRTVVLERHRDDAPADARVFWLTWYPRARSKHL